jgi:hypothetical protein
MLLAICVAELLIITKPVCSYLITINGPLFACALPCFGVLAAGRGTPLYPGSEVFELLSGKFEKGLQGRTRRENN